MRKYLSEKHALTFITCIFCLLMLIITLVTRQSFWQAIGFGLAFSFSVEVLCHRVKENER